MDSDPAPTLAAPTTQNSSSQAPPRLVGPLVAREQLIAEILHHPHCVVLLLGAAGSGKTFTLASLHTLLCQRGTPVRWLTLTTADNTVETLNLHLHQAFPDTKAFILIDGGERITSEQAWAVLENFLLSASEHTTALVTAQTMRRTALYDGVLRGTVQVIGPDRLHMNNDEAATLLGPEFSDSDVDGINRFVQGWPAGLRFLAHAPEAARAIANAPTGQDRALPPTLSSYLADVICPSLSAEAHSTLTQLAVLERFTPKMLSSMPPPVCNWSTVQSLILEGNYLKPLDQEKSWIEVNPALGQHLRHRLKHEAAEHYEALKDFAAAWFADNGFPTEAVRHASGLKDARRAAELIEKAGAIAVELSDGPNIDLSMDLPPQRARDLPLLFFSQVYHRVRHGRHRQARMAFERGFELTSGYTDIAPPADPRLVSGWALIFKFVFASIDDIPIEAADIALAEHYMVELLEAQPVFSASFASVIAWAYIENGQLDDAVRICQMGFDPHDGEHVIRVSLFLHIHWVCVLMIQDNVTRAIDHTEQAQTLAQIECGPDSYEVLIAQMRRGILHYEQDELLEARACLVPALSRLRTINGWLRIYAEAITTAVAVELALDNPDGAEVQLRAGEQFASTRGLTRLSNILIASRAHLALAAGDLRDARDLLESAEVTALLADPRDDAYALFQKPALLFVSAQLMLELKRPRDALAVLDQAAIAYAPSPDTRLRFARHTMSMRACFDLRRYNNAVEHLISALEIARSTGLIRRAREQKSHLLEVFEWAERNGKTIAPRLRAFVCEILGPSQTPAQSKTRARDATSANNLTLSPREAEIITLVAEGLSAKEIAQRLGISEGTVKSHRKKIHGKLGVSTRSQAILKARELLII